MNWCDLSVLTIILVFGLIGYFTGFIMSIFRLASFFISAFLAIKFFHVVSEFLQKTAIYTNIKNSIYNTLLLQQQSQSPKVDGSVKQAAAQTIVDSLHLPGFLKGTIIEQIPNPTKLIDLSWVVNIVSEKLAVMVVDIISLILLFILIRIALIFAKYILKGIAKLPVFKQMDKMGGIAFGLMEGLLMIYIVCAILILFHSAAQFNSVFISIDNSTFAKFFYQNNFIVDWMFPIK